MTMSFRFSSMGSEPSYERAREDGAAAPSELRRRTDGIRDANVLTADEAVALIRGIRARALKHPLPDSALTIRAERDAG